ncbi:MAG: 3-dehydroquinate synthase [Eubacteriales bacterium]|nr:3-dehydroquinate synthase [Eubacteriales bacterium]
MERERRVRVNASREYDVVIASGLLSDCANSIRAVAASAKLAAIVTDDTVNALYGKQVQNALEGAGFTVCCYVMEHGEKSKTMQTFASILQFLAENELTKSDVIVALGGGVPGDIAGFAAACYLRGTPFVQLPTTLLAAVDSSVGGKTAVDLPAGKNLAGAFWQPRLVLHDTNTLSTLPEAQFSEGMAETIKYGVICDKTLFEQAAGGNCRKIAAALIERCVTIKAKLVEQDEFDSGCRQLLNLGHTFGHAIEGASGFAVSHGQAVGMGMLLAARAAEKLEIAKEPCANKIKEALQHNGLPTVCGFTANELLPFAANDKKRRGDTVTLILPETIEQCICHTIKTEELPAYFEAGLR